MKSEIGFSLIVSFIVVMLSIALLINLNNQRFDIIEGGDFSDPSFWQCRGNATIQNGKAHLTINETQGKNCSFSAVHQGAYPHGWDRKGQIKEVEVRKNEASEKALFLRIVANRSEFRFYNRTESIVNIGVMIWIQLDEKYDKPINESRQLELDINFASFLYGWWTNYTVKPITWDTHFIGYSTGEDDDYHYVDSANNVMFEANRVYEISIDVGKSIAKAFERFNIQWGRLRSFDIYIEAKYGYGEVNIDSVEFFYAPKANISQIIFQSMLNGFLAFLATFLLIHLFKRMRGLLSSPLRSYSQYQIKQRTGSKIGGDLYHD